MKKRPSEKSGENIQAEGTARAKSLRREGKMSTSQRNGKGQCA